MNVVPPCSNVHMQSLCFLPLHRWPDSRPSVARRSLACSSMRLLRVSVPSGHGDGLRHGRSLDNQRPSPPRKEGWTPVTGDGPASCRARRHRTGLLDQPGPVIPIWIVLVRQAHRRQKPVDGNSGQRASMPPSIGLRKRNRVSTTPPSWSLGTTTDRPRRRTAGGSAPSE